MKRGMRGFNPGANEGDDAPLASVGRPISADGLDGPGREPPLPIAGVRCRPSAGRVSSGPPVIACKAASSSFCLQKLFRSEASCSFSLRCCSSARRTSSRPPFSAAQGTPPTARRAVSASARASSAAASALQLALALSLALLRLVLARFGLLDEAPLRLTQVIRPRLEPTDRRLQRATRQPSAGLVRGGFMIRELLLQAPPP